jgi:drug/metabolite transporter (DMT)-like permease
MGKNVSMKILLLSIAPLIWGAGFMATRWTFESYGPYWSHGLRYALAAILSIPLLIYYRKELNFKAAFYCAFFLSLGLIFQTVGIGLTTLAKSGFLTTLYVIFVPLILTVYFRKYPDKIFYLFLLLSIFGIALMCDFKLKSFNFGDLLIVISALFFAIHILVVDYYAPRSHSVALNFLQCFLMGPIGIIAALIFEGVPDLNFINPLAPEFNQIVLIGLVILSVFSSLIAFSIQIYAQQFIKPHHAGLVFLLESPFAAFFGYLAFDERLSLLGILGSIFVMIPPLWLCLRQRSQSSI